MNRDINYIGQKLWQALREEGGYCVDFYRPGGERVCEIHWNRGCSPSKNLIASLRANRAALKDYVFTTHDYERETQGE